MKKVVITGGLSAGKSTVCQFLRQMGAYVVEADEIVSRLLSSDKAVRQRVIDLLGPCILVDNQLDRRAIAEKVFSHPETLKSLEHILHPAVFHEITSQYQTVNHKKDYALFVAEVPLLYETKAESFFDYVVAVYADESLCKKRFEQKHPKETGGFSLRMQRQISPEEKAKRADFVLYNNGSRKELQQQVLQLINKLQAT